MLIGGGGHFRSVLDTLKTLDIYDELGVVDDPALIHEGCSVPVVGRDEDIPALFSNGWKEAFVTVGSVRATSKRRMLYEMVKKYGIVLPVIVDPSAVVSTEVVIGEGTYIGKGAIVNTGARIGTCAIINTGSIIEHDCKVGDFVHVGSGATLCGEVEIGDCSHLGAGSVVRQCVHIGSSVTIGLGSVVVKNIGDQRIAYGNPCKVVIR